VKRFVNLIVTALGLAVVLWGLGLVRFVATLPAVTDANIRTDAIVVLTGGEDRLGTGLDLLQSGASDRMLISGVSEGLSIDTLLNKLGHSNYPQDLRQKITLGYKARSTVQNAWETAEWCNAEGVKSIRLVTAAYHMKRSLLELEPVLTGVRIFPHPVYPESIKGGKWWQSPKTLLLMAREYSKFLIASLAHIFGLTTEEFRS